MAQDARLVSIYKSARRAEMYLYVDKKQGLKSVPEPLMQQFGKPIHVLDMLLREDRRLARARAPEVLASIGERGFYLQMPPGESQARSPDLEVPQP